MNSLGARLRGNKLLGSVWASAFHSEKRSSVTSHTEIARQYFFGKRWKPRICPAEFFDFNSRYLENENEIFKNFFETVFRASKSRDRGLLVSAFQLTFNKSDTPKNLKLAKIPSLKFMFKKPSLSLNTWQIPTNEYWKFKSDCLESKNS